MINYALSFLLPIIVLAGFTPSTQTYTTPILPTQGLDIPISEPIYSPSPQIYAETPIVEASSTPEDINCSCVRYIRNIIPDLPNLDAIDFPINTIEPKVGDIIKLQYYNATTTKYIYHLSLIEKITEDGYSVKEGNYEKCKESKRIIPKNDEHILGFFNMDRQRLIDALTPIQKQTLWNESGWSHYDTKGSVLTGKDEERSVAQFMKTTWKWLTEKRREENIKPILLDRFDFEDSIIMFKYGWDKGIVWYGKPPENLVNE